MKAVSGREMCRILERHGWILERTIGSHHIHVKPGHLPISVPVHGNRSLKIGLQRAIMKAAGPRPTCKPGGTERTNEQKAREYESLKEVYAMRSRQGQGGGGDTTKPKQERSTSGKTLPEVVDPPSVQAAEAVGLSRPTADRAVAVVHTIDALEREGETAKAQELREYAR